MTSMNDMKNLFPLFDEPFFKYWHMGEMWDFGQSQAPSRTGNFYHASKTRTISPRGGPSLQRSSKANNGQNSKSFHFTFLPPSSKTLIQFPKPWAKKTWKTSSPIMLSVSREPLPGNTWLAVGLPSWENQELLFGFHLGGKLRKLNKHTSGKLALVLYSSFNFCSLKKSEKL